MKIKILIFLSINLSCILLNSMEHEINELEHTIKSLSESLRSLSVSFKPGEFDKHVSSVLDPFLPPQASNAKELIAFMQYAHKENIKWLHDRLKRTVDLVYIHRFMNNKKFKDIRKHVVDYVMGNVRHDSLEQCSFINQIARARSTIDIIEVDGPVTHIHENKIFYRKNATIHVYDCTTKQRIELVTNGMLCDKFIVSYDKTKVAILDMGCVFIWDLDTGEFIDQENIHQYISPWEDAEWNENNYSLFLLDENQRGYQFIIASELISEAGKLTEIIEYHPVIERLKEKYNNPHQLCPIINKQKTRKIALQDMIKIFDVNSGSCLYTWDCSSLRASFSEDGKSILIGIKEKVQIIIDLFFYEKIIQFIENTISFPQALFLHAMKRIAHEHLPWKWDQESKAIYDTFEKTVEGKAIKQMIEQMLAEKLTLRK